MILVFGGAYQGKLAFARSLLKDNYTEIPDLALWAEGVENAEYSFVSPDPTMGLLVASLDLWLSQNCHLAPEAWQKGLESLTSSFPEETVLVIQDMGQGLVPLDPKLRAIREANGKALQYFAGEADKVYRVLAGQAICLKGED